MSRLVEKPRVLLVTGAPDSVHRGNVSHRPRIRARNVRAGAQAVNVTLIRTVLKSMEIAARAAAPV